MRSGMGWVHSKRLEVSKYVHCLQEWSSKPHLGHWPTGSLRDSKSVPHWEQRDTVRVPGIWIARGPKVSFLTGLPSFSDASLFWPCWPLSWYPRCRYFRSDKVPSVWPRRHCLALARRRQGETRGDKGKHNCISEHWVLTSGQLQLVAGRVQ